MLFTCIRIYKLWSYKGDTCLTFHWCWGEDNFVGWIPWRKPEMYSATHRNMIRDTVSNLGSFFASIGELYRTLWKCLVHLRCCWSDVRVYFSSHMAHYYWSGDFWCLFEWDICSLFVWMVCFYICFLSFLTMFGHFH